MQTKHVAVEAAAGGPPRLVQVILSLDALKKAGLTDPSLEAQLTELANDPDEVELAKFWQWDHDRFCALLEAKVRMREVFEARAKRTDLTRAEWQQLEPVLMQISAERKNELQQRVALKRQSRPQS
jgi:hypothetical protein